jgi:hypothetical protein
MVCTIANYRLEYSNVIKAALKKQNMGATTLTPNIFRPKKGNSELSYKHF